MIVVDLYGGPGGWDVAAEALGLDVLGIEWDDAACATRKAAGLNTLQADVSLLDPLDFQGTTGLIASPPCQTFSPAGKGDGRGDLDILRRAIYQLGKGDPRWRATAAECSDPRTSLVLEPLRWALALDATLEWVALEQVTPVLPLWEMMAIALQGRGYNVWTGTLCSEQYGVPQTRRRAVLMAVRGRPVVPPHPTHQRFDGGPAQASLCGGLLPWVSMADALGWHEEDRVGFPRRDDQGSDGYRDRDRREARMPALAVTEKARSGDPRRDPPRRRPHP